MSRVVVIGAGASGIIASLVASKENEVILLEKNDKIGKKMLLTGNGRCNYWNSDINVNSYFSSGIESILDYKDEVFSYLTKIGIYPKIKDGYYYPNSNQASTIVELFNNELKRNNVKVIFNCNVEDIIKEDDKFIIKSNLDDLICDKVIVATGGCSYPKTGSNGDMFKVLGMYHSVNKLLPSLVPLVTRENVKDWANVRVDGKVSLYVDGSMVAKETGEIQLTEYGVSGIAIFNLSPLASRALNDKKEVYLKINLLPSVDNVYAFLNERSTTMFRHSISEMLETVLPYQVVSIILKRTGLNSEDKWTSISDDAKNELVEEISSFKLRIVETLDFERSQVTIGGIPLSEIYLGTMESVKVDGLYLVGEVLDVDGKCGGFNLAFAFMTGYIAGKSV